MKELILIRHAKSSWENRALTDFDRPLNYRGQHDAPFMGEKLAASGFVPELIITSPAVRTLQTADLFAKALGYPPDKLIQEPTMYEANIQDLLAIIHKIPDTHERVALFGHNPGMTSLCYVLSLHDVENIPTCGMAVIRVDVQSWQDVVPKKGEFVMFDYPKRYKT